MGGQLDLFYEKAGLRCNCERCGRDCQVSASRNPDAEMLRKAAKPKGYCINCAVTAWLANAYPVNEIIETSPHGPAIMLFPQIQEQFGEIMRAGKADANLEEIDWNLVVENWHLPIEVRRSAVNPHLPGDSMRQKLARMELDSKRIM